MSHLTTSVTTSVASISWHPWCIGPLLRSSLCVINKLRTRLLLGLEGQTVPIRLLSLRDKSVVLRDKILCLWDKILLLRYKIRCRVWTWGTKFGALWTWNNCGFGCGGRTYVGLGKKGAF